jgi:uncharacterized protein YjbI with pentapeptide repeats
MKLRMANQEHYRWLMLAVASGNCRKWNDWRIDHPGVLLSLIAIEFAGISLPYINLSRTDLSYGNFSGTNFYRANLQNAALTGANLSNANLRKADLSGSCLRYANLMNADLQYANLSGADLTDARLAGANLTGANLRDIKLGKDSINAEVQRGTGVSLLERAALHLLGPRIRGKSKHPADSSVTARSEERS